jgi:hypothetical protein
MRVLARITGPTERGNSAITDGTNARLIQEMAQRWNPEAVYFATIDGRRGAYVVFELPQASDIPAFCEPLYQGLHAEIDISPVMTMQDLQAGLPDAR